MNVLILTPDSVGSTLLQRLLTIYMQFHDFDLPVINLHELTRGLDIFYSPEFNRELLSASKVNNHQTLSEITALLEKADHYKTCRLAQYHIHRRGDSMAEQAPFYRYLNDNFFIISCRRDNLFEHALGWSINTVTKRLNVYTHQDKIDSFFDLYRNPISIDADTIRTQLDRYSMYVDWCNQYFEIGSYFYYDRDLDRIENYILDLPVFVGQSEKHTWKSVYGQDFSDWNRCHYMTSDVSRLVDPQYLLTNDKRDSFENSALMPTPSKKHILANLDNHERNYLQHHATNYIKTMESIKKMEDLGIVSSGIPIKKQTLANKQQSVRNFDSCLEVYNEWIVQHPELGTPLTRDRLHLQIEHEHQQWHGRLVLANQSDQPAQLQNFQRS